MTGLEREKGAGRNKEENQMKKLITEARGMGFQARKGGPWHLCHHVKVGGGWRQHSNFGFQIGDSMTFKRVVGKRKVKRR